jgi:putative flippase GtrA
MIEKLKNELRLNLRYGFAGILNGITGLGTIWLLTHLGVEPVLANSIGFGIGIVFAFLVSRKFVFRSSGHFTAEAGKYIFSFVLSYLINIAILQLCINRYFLDKLISQGIAVSSYVLSMYLASRIFIFRRGKA